LRRIRPDLLKARKSLDAAGTKLERAKALLKDGHNDAALLYAYSSMFSAGRAILYKDGIQEKSHYCLAKYLEEKYAKNGKIDPETITLLNAFREERHAIMYGFEEVEVGEGEAGEAVSAADKIIRKAEELITAK
ncbi:MAG: HEPN domain-containing protein, partial [Hadesarchaea archaeon]|nr:HEPN domain-containing protein [Hadesarchaea archaeon]